VTFYNQREYLPTTSPWKQFQWPEIEPLAFHNCGRYILTTSPSQPFPESVNDPVPFPIQA